TLGCDLLRQALELLGLQHRLVHQAQHQGLGRAAAESVHDVPHRARGQARGLGRGAIDEGAALHPVLQQALLLQAAQHGADGGVFQRVQRRQRLPARFGRAFGSPPEIVHRGLLDRAQRRARAHRFLHFGAPSAFQPPAMLANTIARTAGECRSAAWLAACLNATLAMLVYTAPSVNIRSGSSSGLPGWRSASGVYSESSVTACWSAASRQRPARLCAASLSPSLSKTPASSEAASRFEPSIVAARAPRPPPLAGGGASFKLIDLPIIAAAASAASCACLGCSLASTPATPSSARKRSCTEGSAAADCTGSSGSAARAAENMMDMYLGKWMSILPLASCP